DHGLRGLRAAGRPRGGRRVLSDRAATGAVDRLYREHFGRAVAALIRALGDWDLAEETVQDAFATAVERWPREGIPRDPAPQLAALIGPDEEKADEEPMSTSVPDERLRLIFTCCH